MNRLLVCLFFSIWLMGCGTEPEKKIPEAPPSISNSDNKSISAPQNPVAGNPGTPGTPPPKGQEISEKPIGEYKEVGYGGEGMSSPLLFIKVKKDFGVVKKGAQVHAEYFYKNTSTHSVEIERSIVSCNCISVEYKKDPIQPGETGSIKVTFHTEEQGPATYEKIISVLHKGTNVVQALLLKGKIVL